MFLHSVNTDAYFSAVLLIDVAVRFHVRGQMCRFMHSLRTAGMIPHDSDPNRLFASS